MTRKLIPYILAAAVVAPLYLSTPAEAQSLRDIQRLEERVNEAKARGNWGAAQDLEVQLNMVRLQYQRNNGMGEVNDRGYYNQNRGFYPPNGNWNNHRNPNGNRNNRNRDRDRWRQQQQQQHQHQHQHQQRGYYDQSGRWHRY